MESRLIDVVLPLLWRSHFGEQKPTNDGYERDDPDADQEQRRRLISLALGKVVVCHAPLMPATGALFLKHLQGARD
jgi:hypothetical protein